MTDQLPPLQQDPWSSTDPDPNSPNIIESVRGHFGKKSVPQLGVVILWVFFFPLALTFWILGTDRLSRNMKAVLIPAVVFVLVLAIGISGRDSADKRSSDSRENVQVSKPAAQVPQPEVPKTYSLFKDAIQDEALRSDFIRAAQSTGMELDKIRNLKQVDDWASGPRYSFEYNGMAFRMYADMDSRVRNLKLGADSDVYKRGYEPYQVADYVINTSIAAELSLRAEKEVKARLNFPGSADFSLLGWGMHRDHDVYYLSNTVEAENALGVKDEIPFAIAYHLKDGAARLIYLALGSEVVRDDRASVAMPERAATADTGPNISIQSESAVITLTDGEIGQYGKVTKLDGDDYISYHPPLGKYIITNKTRLTTVYLAKDTYYKNAEGYMENDIVEKFDFTTYEEQAEVSIGPGQQLELTLNSIVTLTPVE